MLLLLHHQLLFAAIEDEAADEARRLSELLFVHLVRSSPRM